MFRRIGDFLKDITETIKRERGKLQINSDKVDFEFKTGSLMSPNSIVSTKGSQSLQEMFNPLDINESSPTINVKGTSDHSHSPGISSATTSFSVNIDRLRESRMDDSVKSCSCEFEGTLAFKELEIDNYEETELVGVDFKNDNKIKAKVKNAADVSSFELSVRGKDLKPQESKITTSVIRKPTTIKSLKTEIEKKQSAAFHFENSVVMNALIDNYTPLFDVKCYQSLASIMRFPIKRTRVSKSGYETEELKRALSFIVKRYQNSGKLNIVGIYKNVPIDAAERLTFSGGRDLFFYMKKGTFKRPILMDVLIVKTKEGRYHVGPIVREA